MTTTDVDRQQRFEALVTEVHEPLQRYLRRRTSHNDAEDVMGEVLLTLWRRFDSIPHDSALPWCYGVARRTLANHRRGNHRRLQLVTKLEAQPPTRFDDCAADDHPELIAAILDLPAADRELISLWAWEQLEPREIAVVLETTPNAVSLRLTRTKQKLANALQRQNPRPTGHRQGNWTGSKGHD